MHSLMESTDRRAGELADVRGITAAGWRIVLLASLGGSLEFYDFVVFGIFAKDIADAIFPNPTPLVSLMVSFATFAVGYLARPIGGIVLSHFGDRYGRRRVFLVSIFVMSGATLGMGLVPPFSNWGVAASLTMVTLRLVQGFCLGGELPGAITYVVETAPRQVPFVCGFVFACVTMGVTAATAVSIAVRTFLPASAVAAYGWRIAFMVGGAAGILSFLLRRSLEESPEYARLAQVKAKYPIGELLRTRGTAVLTGVAALAATASFTGLFFAHMPAYLCGVIGYDPRRAVISQTIGVALHAASILAVGWLATRVHPRALLRGGAAALILLAYPFYDALVSRAIDATLLLAVAGLCAGLINGTFACLLADLFPTRIRFSGVALVFNVAFTVFSGTAPLVATSLIRATGSPRAPALVMIVCGVLTLCGSLGLRRQGGHVLSASSKSEV